MGVDAMIETLSQQIIDPSQSEEVKNRSREALTKMVKRAKATEEPVWSHVGNAFIGLIPHIKGGIEYASVETEEELMQWFSERIGIIVLPAEVMQLSQN